jgi:DNA (cytosine-5)-methyltransferase 1
MRELALFAGAGGGILGGKLLGWKCVCAVEIDAFCRQVLLARQRDGILEPFPIWDDVKTFDGKPWQGYVDLVSGGFPCQDISAAGGGGGIREERSGLWAEFARIIGEVQPRYVLVENSPMLTVRGLDVVLGDLATLGYNARWGVLGAKEVNSPHERERIWIVADTAKGRRLSCNIPTYKLCTKSFNLIIAGIRESLIRDEDLPIDIRAHYAMAGWVDRLACCGNGQVPGVAAMAWRILSMHNAAGQPPAAHKETV